MKDQAGNLNSLTSSEKDVPSFQALHDASGNGALASCSPAVQDALSNGSDWLCLFTQPHREKLALGALCEAGFEVYLPYRRKLVLRKGKRVPIKAPLFSRYLFIKADQDDSKLYPAHRQKGVVGFAGRTFGQSFIPDRIIREIRERESPDGYVAMHSGLMKPGQKVSMIDGPFEAIEAIFCEAKDEQRSILLLSLLGKTHRVVVSNENLQLVA